MRDIVAKTYKLRHRVCFGDSEGTRTPMAGVETRVSDAVLFEVLCFERCNRHSLLH